MSFEEFDDWDETFLDQAIRVEEGLMAMSSTNPTQNYQDHHHHHHHHQQLSQLSTVAFDPPPFYPAHQDFLSFSPPREFSQRLPDQHHLQPSAITKTTSVVAPQSPAALRAAKEKDFEINRLKRELGRVSKQLANLEQECVELQKDRDKKEKQLNSLVSQIEAKDAEIDHLKSTNVECGAPVEDNPRISLQYHSANSSIDLNGHRIINAQMSCKAVGVQTETFDACTPHLMFGRHHDLSSKLCSIWDTANEQGSGRNLLSRLFSTCSEDLHILFSCTGMNLSSKLTQETLVDKSFFDTALHDSIKSAQSIEAAKVSWFYSMLAKLSNRLVHLDSVYEALLDLCVLRNAVIGHRSLHILHVLLQYMLKSDRYDGRDNVMVEGMHRMNILEPCVSGRVDGGGQFGEKGDETFFSNYISSSTRLFNVETLYKEHENPANATFLSRINWVSLFGLMHQIAMENTEECIRVEAISIMNLVLMRSNPYLEREKFGFEKLFESLPRLLRKEAGFCVQKQALRLLFLLLNCPNLLMMFCSACKDNDGAGSPVYGTKDASAFQGFSSILDGLSDCLTCSGNGEQELKLRRRAVIILAFIASSGKLGFEILLGSGMSRRINFLELIIRVLASELDSEESESTELSEICRERTLFVREALILLNRLASSPAYSAAVLGALTSSRDVTSLTINVVNRKSRQSWGFQKYDVDGTKKKVQVEAEIADLARVFKSRVFNYMGDNIS
ncbi:PREDICTED: uncharacterized protein LOC104600391 [Nelumbo nucifera]|uniref:Uncharacterized protein LOC104600391 n=2 Tax=Nelumbo nucifera TaxID=4432 RepID=A0A1U8A5B2_NELNU|nr:PREDICTED: uncharacterized protein LOC104600391 [Nelumbo nucifera]DAD19226.1 TPA_asm: hypothetical protein HUJ06_020689 [Nelumbo nucifera]